MGASAMYAGAWKNTTMKQIVDYTVVTDTYGDIKSLIIQVNKKVENGWQPFGSLCAGDGTVVYQAMVKYELVIQPTPASEPPKEEVIEPSPIIDTEANTSAAST